MRNCVQGSKRSWDIKLKRVPSWLQISQMYVNLSKTLWRRMTRVRTFCPIISDAQTHTGGVWCQTDASLQGTLRHCPVFFENVRRGQRKGCFVRLTRRSRNTAAVNATNLPNAWERVTDLPNNLWRFSVMRSIVAGSTNNNNRYRSADEKTKRFCHPLLFFFFKYR